MNSLNTHVLPPSGMTMFKDFVCTSAKVRIPLCFSIWKLVIFVGAVTGSWSTNICARDWGCHVSKGLRCGYGETEMRRDRPEPLGTHSKGLYRRVVSLLGGSHWLTHLKCNSLPKHSFHLFPAFLLLILLPPPHNARSCGLELLSFVFSDGQRNQSSQHIIGVILIDICWLTDWMIVPFQELELCCAFLSL